MLEVLSPTNKRQGEGRNAYEKKRNKILGTASHLVEIDLLRSEQPMAMRQATSTARTHYRILVSRSHDRPQADLYGFTFQEPIPQFPVPLKEPSEQVWVDLQGIVQGIYDRSGYTIRIDYHQPVPAPPLLAEEQQWMAERFKATNPPAS